MIFSNNPEKFSLFGGGCNENDRILDLYGGLSVAVACRWLSRVGRVVASSASCALVPCSCVTYAEIVLVEKPHAVGRRVLPLFQVFSRV